MEMVEAHAFYTEDLRSSSIPGKRKKRKLMRIKP